MRVILFLWWCLLGHSVHGCLASDWLLGSLARRPLARRALVGISGVQATVSFQRNYAGECLHVSTTRTSEEPILFLAGSTIVLCDGLQIAR